MSKCGTCGGFYNEKCPGWPACSPAVDAPDPIHAARVKELIEANNREVDRRRAAEAEVRRLRSFLSVVQPFTHAEHKQMGAETLALLATIPGANAPS